MAKNNQSFIQFVEDVQACTICAEHLPLGPRPLLQVAPRAVIMIVGQATGTAVREWRALHRP
jgi:uracil-DNA glycosylase